MGGIFGIYPEVYINYGTDPYQLMHKCWVGFTGTASERVISELGFLPTRPVVSIGSAIQSIIPFVTEIREDLISCTPGFEWRTTGVLWQMLGQLWALVHRPDEQCLPSTELVKQAARYLDIHYADILAALQHAQPERIPFTIGFTRPAYIKMVEYYQDPHFAQKIDRYAVSIGTDPQGSWREVAPNIWEDQFGVHWNRTIDKDIGVVCNCVVTPDTLDSYQFPDPDEPSRYAKLPEFVSANQDKFTYARLGFSLFERAWTLAGMENVLMAMIADKPFANALFDRILDFNLRIIDNACKYPIDCMYFGDDWGQQTGLIMGPLLWREFIKPRIAEMYRHVRNRGKYVMIHSCGKVDELFPELIDLGLDIFNPFQPEVIDVYQTKKDFGDKLTFNGGISTQRTLPFGTPDDVRAEVRQLLVKVGRGGGYIAGPAHSIPGDAKPENIAAMIEVLHEQ